MLKFVKKLLKDERGISTVEVLIGTAIAAVIAITAYTALKPSVNSAANTIGGKLNSAVGSNNPSW